MEREPTTPEPETAEHQVEFPTIPASDHRWVQRGHDLICGACAHPHVAHIPYGYAVKQVNEDGELVLERCIQG